MTTFSKLFLLFFFAVFTGTPNLLLNAEEEKTAPQSSEIIELNGYAGNVIDRCIEKRIKGQDVDHLIEPFQSKNETWCWQSEFWGKWMLSAVGAYKYKKDEALMRKMRYAVDGLLATQMPNGYIGNYGPANQLTGWDIWGRKYSMLGLIAFYEISGDESALHAAQKIAHHLMSQVGPEKISIIQTGFYRGMASSSVLEPVVYLFNHTRDSAYFDFAQYIVNQWKSDQGPKLISKALSGVQVANRFPPPEKWWSWENGQKAYEMMSCYDGLLEFYKITGKPEYLEAVVKTADDIIQHEINIAGSGSAFECWYGSVKHQTRPTYHTMETCVTTTWMKLCDKLLSLTGNSKYADQIERSFYNALMASMKYDASEIAKYSPLLGHRQAGEEQCSMHINCCNANGPRGFVMMPAFGVKAYGNEVFINYYGESSAKVMLESGNIISLIQHSSYPQSGKVAVEISPEKSAFFTVNVRIPAWSQYSSAIVNGDTIEEVKAGEYLSLEKKWKKGDKVLLEFDMRGRLHSMEDYQAITRGPIVLARDSRFEDGFVDETMIIQDQDGWIELTNTIAKPEFAWMAFSAPCKTGTDLEGEGKNPKPVMFCDFASAGNTWDPETRYRVWFKQTLNMMNRVYEGY